MLVLCRFWSTPDVNVNARRTPKAILFCTKLYGETMSKSHGF